MYVATSTAYTPRVPFICSQVHNSASKTVVMYIIEIEQTKIYIAKLPQFGGVREALVISGAQVFPRI